MSKELIKGVLDLDPWLEPFSHQLITRQVRFQEWYDKLTHAEGSLIDFTNSYKTYGLHLLPNGDYKIVEYIPDVLAVSLVGDFNDWNKDAHPLQKANDFGLWQLTIPGPNTIPVDSRYKIAMKTNAGEWIYRLDPWVHRATYSKETTQYEGRFWHDDYKFKNARPKNAAGNEIKIYEAHIGISTPEPKVGSYKNFTENILPIIKDLGYNTIQLMAIMEHAYYASFGYQVTSFFAASSRFGTPDELKELIDTAHGMGIQVLLDVVHSHSSKNVDDGLNMFNGTDHYLFHGGGRGLHDLWDSRLFNYTNYETLRFLLSNLKYYIDVFQFDGFRFDGVTSMLYKHHGLSYGFSGNYNEYFGDGVDDEALVYLMLAHKLMDDVSQTENITLTSIAEDVSGMPTLCRPISEGGIGFDYRLSMAIPDMWIKVLKHLSDEQWDLGNIVHTLCNRRYGEKVVVYCESHDQALVGDKTIAFWLMDAEMYTNMSTLTELTPVIDRGLALHKMIRLITYGLGGEGYLNFEGNEFGHPEWLDFPRVGNGESYHYSRRQFNLIKDDLLRYKFLYAFDRAMLKLDVTGPEYVSLKHEGDKVLVFEKGDLLFIFNFNSSQSFVDYKIGVEHAGKYKLVLDSDAAEFGGHQRLDDLQVYFTSDEAWNHRKNSMQVYIPTRTAIVLQLSK
ncbi:1,4-alpha-glucan-branching enzyme [Candida viswanathii]|uniref:1,4-alpha-glucan-branching enzyme n=1 Tax=Candida viswanathii TaxID=5486 RepID=A0A367XNW2_9ASCO|nr:1,4-alpha-glucan-branching enzyme [Candida viswanathii]